MPTNLDKTTLQALWINGFIPQGTDFANLINSQVNVAETSAQTMQGALITTQLITPQLSATGGILQNITFTNGTVNNTSIGLATPASAAFTSIKISNNITGNVTFSSAATFSSDVSITGGITIFSTAAFLGAASFTTTVSATGFNSSGNTQTASLTETIAIVSANGTTQATASVISAFIGINRLQGTADGQQTGYLLPKPSTALGLIQTVIHEGTVSGNLWPSVGCHINALGANAAFALAASTPYQVTYTQVSGYAVK